jgi:hypothetical protein
MSFESIDHSNPTAVIETLNEMETDILQLMDESELDWDWCKRALERIAWLRHSHVS